MLKTKQIGVYVVTEAGPREAARLVSNLAKVQRRLEELKAQPEPNDEDLAEAEIMSVWAMTSPLLTPAMPYTDWIQTPLTEIAEIRKVAEELNPSWFNDQSEESKKKAVNKAPKSTRKSRK